MDCKIKTSKGMYIGDPCYVLKDEDYDQWCDQLEYEDGVINIGDLQWCAAGTANGDGEYCDNDSDALYGVDSGSIGLVPLELVEDMERAKTLGRVIEVPGEYYFDRDEQGTFLIRTPDNKWVNIATGYDELEDEDWDEEGEEADYEREEYDEE